MQMVTCRTMILKALKTLEKDSFTFVLAYYGFYILEQRETRLFQGFEHKWKLLWRWVLVALIT